MRSAPYPHRLRGQTSFSFRPLKIPQLPTQHRSQKTIFGIQLIYDTTKLGGIIKNMNNTIISKINKIIFIILLFIAIPFCIINGLIRGVSIFTLMTILFLYCLGGTLGIILLINNIIGFVLYRKIGHLIIILISSIWAGYNLYLWFVREITSIL